LNLKGMFSIYFCSTPISDKYDFNYPSSPESNQIYRMVLPTGPD
jgi:hypothetical protein